MNPTLFSAWEKTLAAAPNAPALIDAATGETWSRRELHARAMKVADAWPDALARRVCLLAAPNRPDWFVQLLALLRHHAIVVPLDPGEPAVARAAIASALGAAFAVADETLTELARTRAGRDARRLIKLTSGSTGKPRALPFTDAQMLADGRNVCASMRIASSDFNYALIPFGHSYGLGNLVVPLLAQGTAVVCGSSALPQIVAAEIARHRPTVFPAVPAILRALAAAEIEASQLESLRTVISAGAPLSPEIAGAFLRRFGRRIHNFYGSSETGGIAYDVTGEAALSGRSVGIPLQGVTCAPEPGGRFRVTSAAVFTIGNRRVRDGLGSFRPADRALFTDTGELRLLARTGRAVKIAGRRVDLGEIESALKQLAGVRDAYVMPLAGRADALAAAVAGETDGPALRTALAARLPRWKIPRIFRVVPEFPLTPRGKTDTARLKRWLSHPPSSAPTTEKVSYII